ncbi:HtaA domain-containing protein [Gulosibacter molinativorax]|nr:HtaA domain-containing protein [Gulosibacter molinativorax]QUY63764.1 Hypotetical protein [Gulosibacter molinativorax]
MTQNIAGRAGQAGDGPNRAGLGLYWAVKDSFVRYIRSARDGQIALADGAALVSSELTASRSSAESADGAAVQAEVQASENHSGTVREQFQFGLEQYDQQPDELRLAFRGAVQFKAHFGMLDVTLRNPRLLLRESSAELAIAVHRGDAAVTVGAVGAKDHGPEGGGSTAGGSGTERAQASGLVTWLHVAHVALPNPEDDGLTSTWRDAKTTLTEAGAYLFDDTYAVGEELAPLTLRVPSIIRAELRAGQHR